MTSYQKLKQRCEDLQNQLDIFKNALTIVRQEPQVVEDNGELTISMRYAIMENTINQEMKEHLNHWVANNLDVKTIMRLFNFREFDDIHRLEDEIKKYKKAIEICKNKLVNIYLIKHTNNASVYNSFIKSRIAGDKMLLTEEEFKLLKEVFGK